MPPCGLLQCVQQPCDQSAGISVFSSGTIVGKNTKQAAAPPALHTTMGAFQGNPSGEFFVLFSFSASFGSQVSLYSQAGLKFLALFLSLLNTGITGQEYDP